jgi:hypothetical protein
MSRYPVIEIPYPSNVGGIAISHVCMAPKVLIDAIEIAAVQLIDTNLWWLVNDHNDDIFEPLGPFKTADDAILHLFLLATEISREFDE